MANPNDINFGGPLTDAAAAAAESLAERTAGKIPIKSASGIFSDLDLRTIFLADAPYYVSGSAAVTATVGTTAAGATSVTVASVGSFSENQGIYIAGAGSASDQYKFVAKVTSVSGNQIHFDRATTTQVSEGARVLHDNTLAIQAAIDTVTSGTGVNLFFPYGVINVNGPLLDRGGGIYSMFALPSIPFTTVPSDGYAASIVFEGPLLTSAVSHFSGIDNSNGGGAVIRTETTTAGSIFYGNCATSTIGQFTNCFVHTKHITFQAPDDPAVTMLNFRNTAAIRITDTTIGTTRCQVETPKPTSPTHATGIALVTPTAAGAGINYIESLNVNGFYSGIDAIGDHVHVENAYLAYCLYGVRVNIGYGFSANRIVIDNAYAAFSGSVSSVGYVNVANITVAQASIGILDNSNTLKGYIGLFCDPGGSVTTPINGAANVRVRMLSSQTETFNGFTGLPRTSAKTTTTKTPGAAIRSFDHTVAVPADKAVEIEYYVISNGNGAGTMRLNGASITGYIGGTAGANTVPQWGGNALNLKSGTKMCCARFTLSPANPSGWREVKGRMWTEVSWLDAYEVFGGVQIGALTSVGVSASVDMLDTTYISTTILSD